MNEQYVVGATVFGSWKIKKLIGEGSFGRVFEVEREDFGEFYHAALKVITVPQSENELRGVLEEGMDESGAKRYFYSMVEDIVREFALMAKLKGTANIVSYEDHAVIAHPKGIGWDILIRMELLTPLLPYAYSHPFSRKEIIRLGIDMCRALELCQKYNIIHRDIKPENIFVSENGDFKLGDFGIARTVEKTMSGLSKKGTYNYMAPEVYRGAEYGFSVDIYSLGIVLYRLLNKNRVPFMPPAPESITYSSREKALARRMGGESVPPPFYSEGRLSEVVLKACCFHPKERYSSPMQMRQELEAIDYSREDSAAIYPDGDELALAENLYVSRTPQKRDSAEDAGLTSGTQLVFGKENRSMQDENATQGTQGVFSPKASGTDETSKTQGVFSVSAKPKAKVKAAKKQKTRQEKKRTKTWPVLVALVVVLACTAAAGIYLRQQSQLREEERLTTYNSLLAQAQALYEDNPAEAASLLLQVQDLYPENVEPYVDYAYALYLSREYEKCVDYIENDLALGKSYDISVQNRLSEILGAAYFEQEDYAAAASFFRLSTAGGDITVSAMRDYAVSLGRLGDISAAEEVLQKMLDAGAKQAETDYVQAEVAYAQKEYVTAESGFERTMGSSDNADLQKRAMRSLAELYRDCSAVEKQGESPIENAAEKEARLLAQGITDYGLSYDSTLWEMLGLAYFDAYQMNAGLGEAWLTNAAEAFHKVINLGVSKDYLYSNLFSVYYQMKDYDSASQTLQDMEVAFPSDYTPHALRVMLLITIENGKEQTARNYRAAYQEYQTAESMIVSGDDTTYFQQIESLIDDLKKNGWLS